MPITLKSRSCRKVSFYGGVALVPYIKKVTKLELEKQGPGFLSFNIWS